MGQSKKFRAQTRWRFQGEGVNRGKVKTRIKPLFRQSSLGRGKNSKTRIEKYNS